MLVSPPAESLDTFTIALPGPVDVRRALHPGNESERLLFRNLLPSLVRVDCQGQLRPGLVKAWEQDSNGAWRLSLQENTRFGSGQPLSVDHVVSTLDPAVGANPPGIDSAVVLNGRQIRIFFTGHPDSVLRVLADPAFAMVHGLAAEDTVAGQGFVEILPGETHPLVELRFPLRGDGRDALDRGADLIVTRDPTLLEYAARRSEFTLYPLPWSQTYVLVQPGRAQPLGIGTTQGERQSLARDAVNADARAAEPPFWWSERSCPAGVPAVAPAADRIVYPREDEVARALAERLVALMGPGHRLRAAGLGRSELAGALREGSERAYVLGIPRKPLQPCRELSDFPAGARIHPLLDSRAHAILRLGAPPLSVDWDGTVRVVRP
jgi:hypothetical protein